MSFAMFAGGPVSRNGLREATSARPASWASRVSSTTARDRHKVGRKRWTKTKAVAALNAISKIANIVAEGGGAMAQRGQRGMTTVRAPRYSD